MGNTHAHQGGPRRRELTRAIYQEARTVATRQALADQAVAARLGIGSTDLLCLGVLDHAGPLTAGRLAELTGLTTGAVTGVVDRLEQAGFARRSKDPADRRKVIIHPESAQRERTGALYSPVLDALDAWCQTHSEEELATVLDYLRSFSEALPVLTEHLRAEK
ncbi:MarR family winged helix-turn-helix transcriptional regulator [Streptomyces albus]|uniref:MarR family winged helix-turn-helix transcriptional regulator n=1 Tax=Streptomyces albus TaxID=1888 RepID=UPI0006E37F65|nr:MarR family transcriptional regulator [Streptomyces albus]